jgi:hypothetical protein
VAGRRAGREGLADGRGVPVRERALGRLGLGRGGGAVPVADARGSVGVARPAGVVARGPLFVRHRAGEDDSGLGVGHDVTARVRYCEGRRRSEELEGHQEGGEERKPGPRRRAQEHVAPLQALHASTARRARSVRRRGSTNVRSMNGQRKVKKHVNPAKGFAGLTGRYGLKRA